MPFFCITSITELVWRVPYDYIKCHIAWKILFGVIGMDKLVGVLLRGSTSVINLLVGTAVLAFAIDPGVLDGLVLHVAMFIIKVADAVGAVGRFAAIERAAAQQGCEFSQSHAKHLVVHDVVDALLAVGDLLRQASVEALHNLP